MTKVQINSAVLATIIAAAESHAEDLSTGLADGTYDEGAEELGALEAALEQANLAADPMIFVGDGQYRRRSACSPADIERAKAMGSAANVGLI